MILDRDAVVAELDRRRRHPEARAAARDLPPGVDTERDRDRLALLGVDAELSDAGHVALLGDRLPDRGRPDRGGRAGGGQENAAR